MDTVRINVNSTYGFMQAAPPQILELARAVASDHKLRLDFLYSLNPDCTSMGFTTVRILDQPKHGKITVENGTGIYDLPEKQSTI